MKKLLALPFFLFLLASLQLLNCSKNYTVLPSSVSFTATPTITDTPCGYPGNTCTPTYTYAYTFTPSSTPTSTPTSTVTPVPTLNAPQGVLGLLDLSTGYPNFIWVVDPSAAVTGYQVYASATGTAGSYTLVGSTAKISGADFMTYYNSTTSFNFYVYIVATGVSTNSPPSRVVHAVSGTTSTNGLVISVTSSTTPTFSETGSITGAYFRTYTVPYSGNTYYWVWGDEGAPLTSSVVYGYTGSGLTYVPASSLPAATSNIPITIRTFNNQYWNIDTSYRTFNTP